ncbi:MAG: ribonuclease R [Pseudomonadota bacterium]|nr:ribonuclease R [Pseudomonadota bacterium]
MSFPDRQTVLDFLRDNPGATSKQDIARGLKVKGRERQTLRGILKELEADGTLTKTGKRAWAQSDVPPPTSVIVFERVDGNGDLIARASGKDGPYGPDLVFDGYTKKVRGPAPGVGDRGLARIKQSNSTWSARLMKLFEKRDDERPVTGVYLRTARGGRIKAASRKVKHELHVREGDVNGAEDGDLVVAMPMPQRGYGPVRARIMEIIGRQDDPRAASLLAIAAHDIPTEFPEAVIDQAKSHKPADVARVDLRDTPLITIDPADARDHDDAVFAEKREDGFRVIVAIADVAAYVVPGSPLDVEALKRGNSTYFPDRVVPMLPFELSADACSLKQGQDRYCMAVEMIFDRSGTKRSHTFMRAVMRSAGALSYEEAQQAIDGSPSRRAATLLDDVLRPLWDAYGALSQSRERRGPLELDMPERRVEISDDGTVVGIRTKARFDAHKLIEELMIQANVCAAEELERIKSPLLYRIHDAPSDAKIAALSEFLKTLDIDWPVGERTQTKRFNRLLADFDETEHAEAISEVVLRTQSQAIYSPDNIGHFGLNLKKYAHFTSPIRRYSDLIVHRGLIASLNFGPDGLTEKQAVQLDETAQHLVQTERRSMAAEREANDRYLALFLADRVGAEFAGRITGVTGSGLFVRLEETGADGFCPASRISHEYWRFDDAAQALVAESSGKRFELGQSVDVRLSEVTPLDGGLLLEIISDPKPRRPGEKLQPRTRGKRYDRRKASGKVRRGKGKPGGKGAKRR